MMGIAAERALSDPYVHEPGLGHRTTGQARNEKRKITRNRTSYSCQKCRIRKIKCDKQHPICGSCLKNNEECVYGKHEHEVQNAKKGATDPNVSGAKRRRSPVTSGLSSPPKSQGASVDPPNLEALEMQLHRLSTMIDTIRRDSGTGPYRVPGPLTPMSGEDDWHSGQLSFRSPDQRREASIEGHPLLTRPLSKLDLNSQENGAINGYGAPFWASLVEEVEELQSIMQGIRPLGPPPHADAGQVGCPGHSYRPEHQDALPRSKSHSEPVSFRTLAGADHTGKGNLDCAICLENASDKSILLPGCTSARLATLTKLDLLAGIPSQAQSNALFRAWLTSVYPALPFMSIRHTFKKHQAFWDWKNSLDRSPSGTTVSADVFFMPLLYSIWYAGTVSLSSKGFRTWFPDRTRAQMAAHYHDQTIRYLSLVSFPTNLQAPLIGCLVLLQSIPVAEEEPVQSSTYINLMVKLAQTAGVHREPALFGVAPHEAEIRRRMWWQIVQLDSTFASASGYPTFVGDDTADTRPVSEVHEAYVGSPEEQHYFKEVRSGLEKQGVLSEPLSGSESIVSAFHLVSRTTHSVALAVRKAANMHMSTKVVNKEGLQLINQNINDAEAEVRDTIRRLPTKGVPELGFNPDANALCNWPLIECEPSFGDSITEAEYAYYFGLPDRPAMPSKLAQYHRQKLCAFNRWARISLSAMCDKMYCVAYAPFLKNARSKVWTTGRQCGLHHCTSFLRKFISLATDPSLESFRWSWPGTLHPMHAAIILLVDVYERPHSIEAPRCRALIDKVFSLADPANNIVGSVNGVSTQRPLREGGSEAWDLLRDLRSSGWRKAGLDPHVLWTEEDQILVGVAKPLTAEQKMMRGLCEDLLEPEDEVNAFPQPQAAGTYPGLRYALEAAKLEMVDGILPGSEPGATILSRPEQATSNGQTSRQLFRLSTQQHMPYPLQDFESRGCPGHHSQPDDDHREAAEAEAARVLAVKQQAELLGPNGMASAIFAPNLETQPTTPRRVTQSLNIPGYFNVVTGLSGAANATLAPTPSNKATDTPLSNGTVLQAATPGASELQHNEMDTDGMSAGFDWERWDAVFGQYSGFTDLMEMDADEWHH